eukprot:11079605-Lingulodinium_polyedra.AAC.1
MKAVGQALSLGAAPLDWAIHAGAGRSPERERLSDRLHAATGRATSRGCQPRLAPVGSAPAAWP